MDLSVFDVPKAGEHKIVITCWKSVAKIKKIETVEKTFVADGVSPLLCLVSDATQELSNSDYYFSEDKFEPETDTYFFDGFPGAEKFKSPKTLPF